MCEYEVTKHTTLTHRCSRTIDRPPVAFDRICSMPVFRNGILRVRLRQADQLPIRPTRLASIKDKDRTSFFVGTRVYPVPLTECPIDCWVEMGYWLFEAVCGVLRVMRCRERALSYTMPPDIKKMLQRCLPTALSLLSAQHPGVTPAKGGLAVDRRGEVVRGRRDQARHRRTVRQPALLAAARALSHPPLSLVPSLR